jgi:integrase
MAKWRDADGQHQRVLGKVWTRGGRPEPGYLTKRDAQAELDEILAVSRRGLLPAQARIAARLTLGEAADEWLDYIEHNRCRRASTVRDYRLAIDRVLFKEWPRSTELRTLTTDRIERWKEDLVRSGLAGGTVNKHLLVLQGIFRRAMRRHGLPSNPVLGVERQPIRRSGDFRVLSADQVEALARAAGDERDAALFRTAAFTGMRMGELLALRWRDVDWAKHLVHVRRAYTEYQEDVPKSGRVRSVPLVDQVARALDELSRRERFTGADDLVFENGFGEHLEPSALRRRFYAALDRAGIDRLRFHDLRHSFGTLAVQVFPLSDVKAYMGHADIATTMIYVHHVPLVDAAARLSAALSGEAGASVRTTSQTVPDAA